MKRASTTILVVLTGILLLAVCSPSESTDPSAAAHAASASATEHKEPSMNAEVIIRLGESGAEFVRRHGALLHSWQSIPNVVQDYRVVWPEASLGIVRLDHGRHAVAIQHVMSVQSSEDLSGRYAGEGLYNFHISAGVSEAKDILHDDARLKIHHLLQRFLNAGWQPLVDRTQPRLKGRYRLEHTLATSNINGLDPAYLPTLEEWMRIEQRTPWEFYADGWYLKVAFSRDPQRMDPLKPGAYLLSFTVRTETDYFRDYAPPEQRHRWKEFVAPAVKEEAQERAQAEAELRARGIPIDEAYRDPPVPRLD